MPTYDDDMPRRLRVVQATGWTMHDYPCPHGCYFHDQALGQPCCSGLCCKGNGDTPEARRARALAEAVQKRIAERTVRIGMDRVTGRPVLEGLTPEEQRIGSDNLVLYLSEHGTPETRAAIDRARGLARSTARTATRATDRAVQTVGHSTTRQTGRGGR